MSNVIRFMLVLRRACDHASTCGLPLLRCLLCRARDYTADAREIALGSVIQTMLACLQPLASIACGPQVRRRVLEVARKGALDSVAAMLMGCDSGESWIFACQRRSEQVVHVPRAYRGQSRLLHVQSPHQRRYARSQPMHVRDPFYFITCLTR